MNGFIGMWVVFGPLLGYVLGFVFGSLDRKSKEEEQ